MPAPGSPWYDTARIPDEFRLAGVVKCTRSRRESELDLQASAFVTHVIDDEVAPIEIDRRHAVRNEAEMDVHAAGYASELDVRTNRSDISEDVDSGGRRLSKGWQLCGQKPHEQGGREADTHARARASFGAIQPRTYLLNQSIVRCHA